MINPKGKATEIYNKMFKVEDGMSNYPMCHDTAKKCALIAVEIILNDCGAKYWGGDKSCEGKNFWNEVKNELSKL